MKGETHLLGGICVGLSYAALLHLYAPLVIPVVVFSAIGSLFPDIDTQTSTFGSKVKPLSFLIDKSVGHRTLFHSPFLYFLLGFLLICCFPQERVYTTAFLLGSFSHLLLDLLNPKGIPLLYPYLKKYHLARIQCGGKGDSVLGVLLALYLLAFMGLWIAKR